LKNFFNRKVVAAKQFLLKKLKLLLQLAGIKPRPSMSLGAPPNH
jgi:hypothetical protein